jgi:hypothetical protein
MSKYRMTASRRAAFIDLAMAQAARLECSRRSRTLQRSDVERLIDACRAYGQPISHARAYAGNGDFVPNSYKWAAPITVVDVSDYGMPVVSVSDAKRSMGHGSGVTINNRAVS